MPTEDEDKMVRDWDFDVNLSGLNAPTGRSQLPEGYYEVLLADLFINPEKNSDRVVIKVTVNEGQFKGMKRVTGINRPKSEDDKVRYYWRGLAESAGYTPAQLDAGSVKLSPSSFKSKRAFIRYTPKNDENEYDKVSFLAPAEWAMQKQAFVGTPSNGEAKPEAKPSATKTKAEVLRQLGL